MIFYRQIKLLGTDLTKTDLNNKISKILDNLEKIKKNYNSNNSSDKVEYNYFRPINNVLLKFNQTVNEIDPSSLLIKYNKDENFFEKCLDLFDKCETATFNDEELSSLLEGELNIDNINYQFVGTNFEIEKI